MLRLITLPHGGLLTGLTVSIDEHDGLRAVIVDKLTKPITQAHTERHGVRQALHRHFHAVSGAMVATQRRAIQLVQAGQQGGSGVVLGGDFGVHGVSLIEWLAGRLPIR